MKKPDLPEDNTVEKGTAFPETMVYLMFFGGIAAHDSKCRQKLTCREVYTAEPATRCPPPMVEVPHHL
jgi:hypothetical protein